MTRSTIEPLELRRLLSVALKSNGTLQINGTTGEDVVRIGFDDTFVNLVAVTLNSKQKLFQPRDVRQINIQAGSGRDQIVIESSLTWLGAIDLNINTSKGNDRVTVKAVKNVNISVALGDGDDTLKSDAALTVKGGAGDDEIIVRASERQSKAYGGDGNDALMMTYGNAYGGMGNDTLTGSASMYGGDGDDILGTYWLNDEQGTKIKLDLPGSVNGNAGNDVIIGSIENMRLSGDSGNDQFMIGNNLSIVGEGEPTSGLIDGGEGDDVVKARLDDNSMNSVTVFGGAGNDHLRGVVVFGDSGNDLLEGTMKSDRLYGGEGNDTLYGGGANDWLDGGRGDDHLYGGWKTGANLNAGHDYSVPSPGDDFYDPNHEWAESYVGTGSGASFTHGSQLPVSALLSALGSTTTSSPNPTAKVPAANAIAYIGNSALLAGVNQLSETSKFLKNPPELSSTQINKIKPGIVSIRSDWNVTRVGVEGNLLWLKVSRTGNSGTQFPIKVTLDEFPTRFSSTSNLNSYSLESRLTLQTSFLAIHKKSLLAMGGLTGSSTPMSATFDNIRQLPLAKDARLRFANDWSRVFTVKDKAPLEPGVNPHGRRGVIVDNGIIWFDDVEQPYFQEIEL